MMMAVMGATKKKIDFHPRLGITYPPRINPATPPDAVIVLNTP